ncbi:hypothetical protein BDW62DRAFT_205054 [Aspergillus aurantiobrunneus]
MARDETEWFRDAAVRHSRKSTATARTSNRTCAYSCPVFVTKYPAGKGDFMGREIPCNADTTKRRRVFKKVNELWPEFMRDRGNRAFDRAIGAVNKFGLRALNWLRDSHKNADEWTAHADDKVPEWIDNVHCWSTEAWEEVRSALDR